MINSGRFMSYLSVFLKRPDAEAEIHGSKDYSGIEGNTYFYQTKKGVILGSEISGLPNTQDVCKTPVFGFHIHEGTECSGNEKDPFADAMSHYNPKGCLHPYHAGDLPPLFGVNGYAFQIFFSDRFTVDEIIGKTIIIHSAPDDFTTQPSGNAGKKIACGVIKNIN